MPTPDELRSDLAAAREEFKAALGAVAAGWEKGAGGSGEDAWSARQTAEHAIPVEAFFATAICTACGYPGVDTVTGSYASPVEAAAHFDEVIEMCNKKLKYVSAEDLEKKHEQFGTAGEMLAMNATVRRCRIAQQTGSSVPSNPRKFPSSPNVVNGTNRAACFGR